ncbi:glycopeptide antibiotics resistance protein [Evansella vedderi]|uniref:Glycopeptide antibiotics resistance protein n=1 Tax=Evansella vedderi TaxID=38282 RepID=A0ABU0A221_9BACI|nr:VanZ family protein [Evansella vedderi]MDQ0257537.1 glycopeptide antibiotics resistance protein [Evansella vedderi]
MTKTNIGEKKKSRSLYPFASWLLFIYLIVLFYITLFAWNYGASLGPVGPGGRNYNLDPFFSIYRIAVYSPSWVDPFRILVGNVLLFIPFGFLLPLFVERWKTNDKPVRMFPVVVAAMCLSIAIEINQFVFTYRVANIDDVILNTTGALIGVIAYRLMRWSERFKKK